MTHPRSPQRGEGKIGCMVSLLVLGILIAAAIKLVPVYYTNNEFQNAVEEIAGRAGTLPLAAIEKQIKSKARELEIPEALAAGALVVTQTPSPLGDGSGTCAVTIKYNRKVDLYGVTSITISVDKTKSVGYIYAR